MATVVRGLAPDKSHHRCTILLRTYPIGPIAPGAGDMFGDPVPHLRWSFSAGIGEQPSNLVELGELGLAPMAIGEVLADGVFVLAVLFPSAKKDDQHRPVLSEINPVTGSELKLQFRYATSYGFHLTKIARFHSINTDKNPCSRLCVTTEEPLSEWLSSIACLTNNNFVGSSFQAFYRPLHRVTLISRERIARPSNFSGRTIML